MILITTAGKVGSEASRLLAARGVPVRVIARSADKAATLATEGVDVFKGDLEVPASIDAAMEGVASVVLVTSPVVKQELNTGREGLEDLRMRQTYPLAVPWATVKVEIKFSSSFEDHAAGGECANS